MLYCNIFQTVANKSECIHSGYTYFERQTHFKPKIVFLLRNSLAITYNLNLTKFISYYDLHIINAKVCKCVSL